MKKFMLFLILLFVFITPISAEDLTLNAKSSILIEASTGKILYEKNFGPSGCFEQVHRGDWRAKAVKQLRSLGITTLFESDVMSKESFHGSYR